MIESERVRINDVALDLLKRMWRDRDLLVPDKATVGPFDILKPNLAAQVLGMDLQVSDHLGKFGHRGDRFEVAGVINGPKRLILVSRKFRTEIRHFTAAHEIGHCVLHPGLIEAHRDRPISSTRSSVARSPMEREADYFAACFLMPTRLLAKELKATFGLEKLPLIIDDHATFFLGLDRRRETHDLHAASAVASAQNYQGRHFYSLAAKFGVSTEAMAIRLNELGFVLD